LLATGAAITAFSIKAAGDFDSGFREIATLIDEPISALDEFKAAILEYGANSSSSLEQVNSAIYSAISAGVDYTDSLEAVRVAEQLSIAGKGDLDSTLTLLVSSLNAYGLSTQEAERFSDALFTTVRLGQTTLPELNESLQQVTGTAATVGVPFEEVLAALAALTSAGTPTTQAVTQISAVLTGVLKPSQQAAEAAKNLGIEFSAQAVRADGLQGFLQKVADATGGNEEIMAKLFPRVEALRAVFPLTGIAAEKFAGNLVELENAAGATEAAYQKMADGFDQISGRLSSSFQAIGVAIGDPLLDEFGDVANAIGEILGVLSSSFNNGDLAQITAFIEEEFGNLAEVLSGVADALPRALSEADLTGFTSGLTAIQEAVGSLFGNLDLTDAEDLARAIEFIGSAFNGLSQFSGGVIESFASLAQYFAELAESASQGDSALRDLGNAFGIASQINLFAGALGGATSALSALVGILVANQAGGLLGGLGSLAKLLQGQTGIVALLGKAGLIGAAGGAGVALGTLANKAAELTTGRSLSEWASQAVGEITGLNDRLEEQGRVLTQTTGPSAEAAARDIAALDEEMQRLASSGGDVFDFTSGLASSLDDAVATLIPYSDAVNESADATQRLGADGQSLTGYFSVVSSGAKSTASTFDDLANASDELKAKLAVAAIEAQGAIQVANIEADAERAVAAFDALASSVQSTGDVLGGLYDLLSDENISKFDKLSIKESIADETDARQKLLEKQIKLTSAEIRLANARAASLERGDSLITINGDGLQPHLEAFMFEILEAIQVRVNADGAELLLGV